MRVSGVAGFVAWSESVEVREIGRNTEEPLRQRPDAAANARISDT
jgi:hypothetical protein